MKPSVFSKNRYVTHKYAQCIIINVFNSLLQFKASWFDFTATNLLEKLHLFLISNVHFFLLHGNPLICSYNKRNSLSGSPKSIQTIIQAHLRGYYYLQHDRKKIWMCTSIWLLKSNVTLKLTSWKWNWIYR